MTTRPMYQNQEIQPQLKPTTTGCMQGNTVPPSEMNINVDQNPATQSSQVSNKKDNYISLKSFFPYLRPGTVSLLRGTENIHKLGVFLAYSTPWEFIRFFHRGSAIPEIDNTYQFMLLFQRELTGKPKENPKSIFEYFLPYTACFTPPEPPIELCCPVPLSETVDKWNSRTQGQATSFFSYVRPNSFSISENESLYWTLCDIKKYPEWMAIDYPCKTPKLQNHIIPPYTLFFLSGFDFRLNPDLQQKTLNSLRKRKCAVVLIDAEGYCDPETFPFDYIFTCTCTCKNRNAKKQKLRIEIKDQSCQRYISVQIFSSKGSYRCFEKTDKYKDIEPLVRECVKQGKTANEIIDYLAQYKNCKLSKPNLARLKRKWGIRSYREEKKPRATKRKKSDGQSPANA